MKYEVEQKFPVADLSETAGKLAEMGAEIGEPQCEVDLYFAHPGRDFAVTDEALRIRTVGDSCWITYKGPKIDATTKTRRELQLPLSPEAGAAAWQTMLEALGFVPAGEVTKHRRRANLEWQERQVEVTLDEVQRLGTFVEIEVVTDSEDLDAAKACVAALADHLRLSGSQRRSYLELLLEGQGG